jgi:gingipain R
MLIVTSGAFLNTLEPFIQWKKRTGMPVFICNTDTLSGGVNETTLKGISKWYYQNKQIAYMLLVGDHQQIPAINSPIPAVTTLFGACCDWPSSYINNNDHYPEFIVGRFSAQTVGELQTQLIKSIQYEMNPDLSTNWMNKQIGVASKEGDVDSDDSQLDFEHICNILDSNKNQFTYVNNQGYFDGDQTSCNDAPGYPTPTDIQTEFNNGIGLMNYCGHGSVQAITSSGFSNTQAYGITNTQAHPIVFSTACYNGTFMNGTCLAEALMQAKAPNGNPTGSVATLMCSILQAWNPPMEGQDEMNAIIRGVRSNNIRTSYGAIVASGNMALMDKYNDFADPDGGNEVADTWVLFGDPSLEIRTNQEGFITSQHSGWLQKGNTIFHVNCPVEGARVSFVYQNEVIASSLVQGGLATLYFAPVNNLDSISVTVTKQNWVPYLGRIDVVDFPLSTWNSTAEEMRIYPNPATELLFIKGSRQQALAKIEILDLSGRTIHTLSNPNVDQGLSVAMLTPGSYMLRIISSEGSSVHRFTKQ